MNKMEEFNRPIHIIIEKVRNSIINCMNKREGLNMPNECIPCKVCGISPDEMDMKCLRSNCPNPD